MAAPALTAQAQAEPGADSGELHAARRRLLANADAWRDADPRRRFFPALRALAQAYAGNSHAALVQAARSPQFVLGREPAHLLAHRRRGRQPTSPTVPGRTAPGHG